MLAVTTINGFDLALIALGFAALAYIIATANRDEREETEAGSLDVVIRCSSVEERDEVYYYLAREFESGQMPYDVDLYVGGRRTFRDFGPEKTKPFGPNKGGTDLDHETVQTGIYELSDAGTGITGGDVRG